MKVWLQKYTTGKTQRLKLQHQMALRINVEGESLSAQPAGFRIYFVFHGYCSLHTAKRVFNWLNVFIITGCMRGISAIGFISDIVHLFISFFFLSEVFIIYFTFIYLPCLLFVYRVYNCLNTIYMLSLLFSLRWYCSQIELCKIKIHLNKSTVEQVIL